MNRPPALQKALKIVLIAMPLAVLGNLLYTALSTGSSGFRILLRIPLSWMGLAVLLSLVPWVFAFLRMKVWASFFRLDLKSKDLAEIVLANDVAAVATPTAMGGGYAKVGLLIYHGARPGLAASLMVIGSIEDYLSMFLTVAVCWPFFAPAHLSLTVLAKKLYLAVSQVSPFVPLGFLAASGAVAFLWSVPTARGLFSRLFRIDWIQRRVIHPVRCAAADFRQAFALISRGGKGYFALNVFLAALQWAMRYSIFTVLAVGIGLSPHPITFFLMQWLVYMLMNFVPTPGAIGGAEVMFMLVFKGAIPAELLPVASAAWRFVSTYLMLIVAAVLMLLIQKPRMRRRPRPEGPTCPLPATPKMVKLEPVAEATELA